MGGKEYGVRRRICVSIEVCRRPQEGKQECTDGELEKAAVNAARFSHLVKKKKGSSKEGIFFKKIKSTECTV